MSSEDWGKNILSFFNCGQGISIVGLSLLEKGFFSLSLSINDSQVLLVLEGSQFVNFQVVSNSDFLSLASGQLSLWISENWGGISYLSSSEFEFRCAFSFFDIIDVIMLDLFLVDGVFKFTEDVEDSIKGGFSLELSFYLKHDGHDWSLLAIVQRVFLKQVSAVYWHNKNYGE